NTIRAVLRDVQIREQAGEIQKLIRLMQDDVSTLGERVDKVRKQFTTVSQTLEDVDTSRKRIAARGTRILNIELQQPAVADLVTDQMAKPESLLDANPLRLVEP
ncbi:MAG: DNA recombination protein RmuC, partial [Alphaproteobacteria bacterium]|nr:DNA recombination protein RmuC [Alphaproteobacteria bacterium]